MPSQSDLIYIGICYKRKISIAHHCSISTEQDYISFLYPVQVEKANPDGVHAPTVKVIVPEVDVEVAIIVDVNQ